jgi:DNA-binding transcriptional ArsR family regulator
MTDNVVFLEPGDERAQKIAKAMGSQTASDILQILGEGPRSLTDITERLNIPMNTAKYHIENLLDAGLIAVEKTKYSIKGREVKIYMLTNQLLVVAPRQSDVRSLLLKYASLFGIVAVCSVMISILSPVIGPGSMFRGSANTLNMAPGYMAPEYGTGQDGMGAAKVVSESMARNMSQAPDMVVAGTEGMVDTWTGNVSQAMLSPQAPVTPVLPTPVPAAIVPPEPTLAAGTLQGGAGGAFPALDPALAFFLGGVLVIFILLCYEAWLWKRHSR